jgi:hypothetical protein
MILSRQWQTGARIDPDFRSGAMCFVLAIAAYTLKVGPIVLATAFGYRLAMMHLGGHRDPALDQATFATWFSDQLLGPQLAPPPIAAFGPAVTQRSIQGGRLPGISVHRCTDPLETRYARLVSPDELLVQPDARLVRPDPRNVRMHPYHGVGAPLSHCGDEWSHQPRQIIGQCASSQQPIALFDRQLNDGLVEFDLGLAQELVYISGHH